MKLEKKISLLFLSMALLMTAACTKDDTPAEAPTPVGFRAMSQVAVVKSGTTESLSNYHNDFGVWGIATEAINLPYVLWKESAFEKVEQIGSSDNYAPVTDAYWLTGYTYKFLALAPYESGVSALSINKNLASNNQSATPSISFTYDMSEKYNPTTQSQTPNYAFDLLGAAASHTVNRNEIRSSQDLVFWHLFSKININVVFVDNNKNPLTTDIPVVKEMRLCNVKTKADYRLSYEASSSDNLSLTHSLSSNASSVNLTFTSNPQVLHVVPQNIGGFKLYLDFEMKTANGVADFEDFEVNLFPTANIPTEYTYNNQYNWNITIGPKQAITFNVTVTPWTTVGPDDDGGIPEIEIK